MPKPIPWMTQEYKDSLARLSRPPRTEEVVVYRTGETPPEPKPARRAKYPWDEWMDGEWHDIQEGRDFHVPLESFRAQLYIKAARANMQVQTMVVSRREGILTFCFMDEPPGT